MADEHYLFLETGGMRKDRKTYHGPHLTELGDLRSLTLGLSVGHGGLDLPPGATRLADGSVLMPDGSKILPSGLTIPPIK